MQVEIDNHFDSGKGTLVSTRTVFGLSGKHGEIAPSLVAVAIRDLLKCRNDHEKSRINGGQWSRFGVLV